MEKDQLLTTLYRKACQRVSSSPENWQRFLQSASRNFHLRFDEQVLIYQQKPSATAVFELDQWRSRYGRRVNRGARGIAVFGEVENGRQQIRYYFDQSDTHPGYQSRPVLRWEMKSEDEPAVIETLENTFGELERKGDVGEAVISAASNLAEDNLKEYLSHLKSLSEGSLIEKETPEKQEEVIRRLVARSVACMIMSRLGLGVSLYPEVNDFSDICYFNQQEAVTLIGSASSDIARMALSEISRTIGNNERDNRIFENRGDIIYNMAINRKGGEKHGSDLSNGGESNGSQREPAETGGDGSGSVCTDERAVSEEQPTSAVLPASDQLSPLPASEGDRETGDGDGNESGETDGKGREGDRGDEENGYVSVDLPHEQHPKPGEGDRDQRTHHELTFFDWKAEDTRLPFFGWHDKSREVFLASDKLLAEKQEIEDFYQTQPEKQAWVDYIRSIINPEPTSVRLSDGTIAWYQAHSNGVLLWEGTQEERTWQSFYRWSMVGDLFIGMHLMRELTEENAKEQWTLEGIAIGSETEKDKQTSIFTQEIIDIAIRRGGAYREGLFRIMEHFSEDRNVEENVKFLKKEYGIGGSSYAVVGTDIGEMHDGKGLKLHRGYGPEADELLLPWRKVAKRIHELIREGAYVLPRQMEEYRAWKQARDEERARYQPEEKETPKPIPAPLPTVPPSPEKVEETAVQEVITFLYKEGDKVYIGLDPYEILFLHEENVILQDARYPLFQKEMSRPEFEQKLIENPLNSRLVIRKVIEVHDEESELEEAKSLIIEYGMREFCTDEEKKKPIEQLKDLLPDLSDISRIELACSTTEDEKHMVVVTADLTRNALEWYVDEEKLDAVIYPSLRRLIDEELKFLSYDDLVGCVDLEEIVGKEKETETDIIQPKPVSRIDFDLPAHPIGYAVPKERCAQNIEAIRVLKQIEKENRLATAEEQEILSRYVGWGGLSEAFDSQKWPEEYGKLQMVMTPEEFKSASASTLTAFFTPTDVIEAVYRALGNMGFTEGNILEPSCGIGHFFGMLPEEMKQSRLYGVELDSISARIAGQLYQTASVMESAFEKAELPDNFFDVVVGNVPFGDYGVVDRKYEKNHFLIHDYFFAKSLDKLRPGGVMALITSKGTMDKKNEEVRQYLADRAELLGAIRLPTSTFVGNANARVTSDILFLQKRERIIHAEQDWIHLDVDENGVTINRYYLKHPEMILGKMELVSTQYGYDSACIQQPGTDLGELMLNAADRIKGTITEVDLSETEGELKSIAADPAVRNFSYTITDGTIYFRENSRMYPTEISETAKKRISGMIGIRDTLRELLKIQVDGAPDTAVEEIQKLLDRKYDAFTRE